MSIWQRIVAWFQGPRIFDPVDVDRDVVSIARILSAPHTAQVLHDSIKRLSSAGLRIRVPSLELVAVRLLCDLQDRTEDGELTVLLEADDRSRTNSIDLEALWVLASEWGSPPEQDDILGLVPALAQLTAQEKAAALDMVKSTVFENASRVWTTNEDEPESYVRRLVLSLVELTGGDIDLTAIDTSSNGEVINANIKWPDGQIDQFWIADEKRPDITSLVKILNNRAITSSAGCYVCVADGDSDSLTFLYLRSGERDAFRKWAAQQHCAAGDAPIDWFV